MPTSSMVPSGSVAIGARSLHLKTQDTGSLFSERREATFMPVNLSGHDVQVSLTTQHLTPLLNFLWTIHHWVQRPILAQTCVNRGPVGHFLSPPTPSTGLQLRRMVALPVG